MGQVVHLPTSTQVHVDLSAEKVSLGETSTPTLSLSQFPKEIFILGDSVADNAAILSAINAYRSSYREALASTLSQDVSAELLFKSEQKIASIPVSEVSKLAGATLLVICLLSLAIWYLTDFAIINPFFAILITIAAVVFLAMGLVLQMREKSS